VGYAGLRVIKWCGTGCDWRVFEIEAPKRTNPLPVTRSARSDKPEEERVGAKTWMLVYAKNKAEEALRGGPQLDREATLQLATRLFPKDKLELIGEGDLSYTCPPDDELHVGCFPGISILAAKEFGIDYPSKLPAPFISAGGIGTIYLHAMHSVVDWFAFAQWSDGELVRSLSLSPDSGILEDIGQRLPFEEPFWNGQNSATDDKEDDYPFPFHPLELGEAALKEFFGYQLEGFIDATLLQPDSIPLVKYKRRQSRWKLW
jgi:uncharacterized protein DUF6928